MKRILPFALLIVATCAVGQQASPPRPKITGIDHVSFYTTAADANHHLYTVILGLATAEPIEPGETQRFLAGSQWIGYSPAPDPKAIDRMDHVAFSTSDIAALRAYLAAKGVAVPDSIQQRPDGSRSFEVKDPEGRRIEFVERGKTAPKALTTGEPVSRRMIHVGFIVRDRAAEDRFYKDVLGFHVYWHGGMKDGQTDWVAMQVPDGTGWLEYMLNIAPHPDLRTTGVMNHLSLGVVNMKQAEAKVEAHGWDPHGDQHVQMGKDGKWQLNLFDPDLTRIELMEFKPVEKPCCSEFQGPHPQEP
jgi:catechol 2,3-dioxygenase-like lactoylglutathione lyase family enzyme